MISTWPLLVMLVHKVKSNSSSRLPDSFTHFWTEATDPEILRTFYKGRLPSLIAGNERYNLINEQTLHRIQMHPWWCGCCIIHLCLQCDHITPQCHLWLHSECVLFAGLSYTLTCIWKCDNLPLFLFYTLDVMYMCFSKLYYILLFFYSLSFYYWHAFFVFTSHLFVLFLLFLPPPPTPPSITPYSIFSPPSLLIFFSSYILLLFHLFFLYSFSYNLTEVQSKVDSKIGLLTHVYIHTQTDKFVYILISTFSSTNSMSLINIHSWSWATNVKYLNYILAILLKYCVYEVQ